MINTVVSMDQLELFEFYKGENCLNLDLDKDKLVGFIDGLNDKDSVTQIKNDIKEMLDSVEKNPFDNPWCCDAVHRNGNVWKVDKDIFLGNLKQIHDTKTIERVRYYLGRLKTSITRVKTGKINDLNLNRWKECTEIRTDSLWVDKKRDRAGRHMGSYWGNFIPQIPRQMMLRYTKAGDYILDTFAGSGTTLIECRRIGRNGIGLELNPAVASEAQKIVDSEENIFNVNTKIVNANSVTADYKKIVKEQGINKVQLVIMHPPYYDIIRFSDNEDDLSNAASVDDFLDRLEEIGRKTYEVLEKGRYACLVIGDKYHNGEWMPLGFWSMERLMNPKVGFSLKSIIVKNFDQTKAKRQQEELWRYRAMVGGYYIFKHEYIFLLQK
jgi:DNA modification methylase